MADHTKHDQPNSISNMKKVFVIILSVCFSTIVYSQSKFEYGITVDGSWFRPEKPSKYSFSNKSGFGTGLGIYASRNIFWRFYGEIGIIYRYKEMEQYYSNGYSNSGGYNGVTTEGVPESSIIGIEGWKKYPHNYLVIPLKLQILTGKRFFLDGGIEISWLTNYNMVTEKPEFNWIMGFGSKIYRMKWSVNFIRGFKPQGFANGLYELENGKYLSATVYRNSMFQFNVSYQIRPKK